jgi:hypothetical protein
MSLEHFYLTVLEFLEPRDLAPFLYHCANARNRVFARENAIVHIARGDAEMHRALVAHGYQVINLFASLFHLANQHGSRILALYFLRIMEPSGDLVTQIGGIACKYDMFDLFMKYYPRCHGIQWSVILYKCARYSGCVLSDTFLAQFLPYASKKGCLRIIFSSACASNNIGLVEATHEQCKLLGYENIWDMVKESLHLAIHQNKPELACCLERLSSDNIAQFNDYCGTQLMEIARNGCDMLFEKVMRCNPSQQDCTRVLQSLSRDPRGGRCERLLQYMRAREMRLSIQDIALLSCPRIMREFARDLSMDEVMRLLPRKDEFLVAVVDELRAHYERGERASPDIWICAFCKQLRYSKKSYGYIVQRAHEFGCTATTETIAQLLRVISPIVLDSV